MMMGTPFFFCFSKLHSSIVEENSIFLNENLFDYNIFVIQDVSKKRKTTEFFVEKILDQLDIIRSARQ